MALVSYHISMHLLLLFQLPVAVVHVGKGDLYHDEAQMLMWIAYRLLIMLHPYCNQMYMRICGSIWLSQYFYFRALWPHGGDNNFSHRGVLPQSIRINEVGIHFK